MLTCAAALLARFSNIPVGTCAKPTVNQFHGLVAVMKDLAKGHLMYKPLLLIQKGSTLTVY